MVFPCFALWLGTVLRNAEVIGLTWDCVRLDEGELLISKTLKRIGTATLQRVWSGTKTGKSRFVPLSQQVVEVLSQHKETMQCLGLNTKDGLVFVTPRTHGHLYDAGLEKDCQWGCIAFDAPTANTTVMPLATSIRGISILRKDLQVDGGLSAIAVAWQRPCWTS